MSHTATELKNVTIGPILKGMVRACLVTAYANELPETIDHTADLLLPHVSLDAMGELRFDSTAASIAPRLVATEIKGNEDDAKLRRAEMITKGLTPLPRAAVVDARAAIAALSLPSNPSDHDKLLNATLVTSILERAGYSSGDPNGE